MVDLESEIDLDELNLNFNRSGIRSGSKDDKFSDTRSLTTYVSYLV